MRETRCLTIVSMRILILVSSGFSPAQGKGSDGAELKDKVVISLEQFKFSFKAD